MPDLPPSESFRAFALHARSVSALSGSHRGTAGGPSAGWRWCRLEALGVGSARRDSTGVEVPARSSGGRSDARGAQRDGGSR